MVAKFITSQIIHTTFTSGDVIRQPVGLFQNLKVIPSGFDGSKNTPKRNGKFRRATEIFKKNEEVRLRTPTPLFEG